MPQSKIHYGWIVVGVTFMTLLIGAGVRSAPGILLVPLESRTAPAEILSFMKERLSGLAK